MVVPDFSGRIYTKEDEINNKAINEDVINNLRKKEINLLR